MKQCCLAVLALALVTPTLVGADFASDLPAKTERVWIGPEFWANRLQDWRLHEGRIECTEGGANRPYRTLHLLTHRLADKQGTLEESVRLGLSEPGQTVSPQAAGGFLLGAGSADLDYRAAALVHHAAGPGAGIFAGVTSQGQAFFLDREKLKEDKIEGKQPAQAGPIKDATLALSARPAKEDAYALELTVRDRAGKVLSSAEWTVPAKRLVGNLALVSHPGAGKETGRWWFRDWKVAGSKLDVDDARLAGPILCTQYTTSRGVLKLTAQLMPIGPADTQTARLEIMKEGKWTAIATAKVIAPAFTATFRVPDWDMKKDVPYRVVYDLVRAGGKSRPYEWTGTIRKDPQAKETIVVAGFTGNHNTRGGVDTKQFDWSPKAMWFPHNDVVKHVKAHQPDVLFFSGDQVYEGASPTSADRSGKESSLYDYLYKWYLWCWAYQDLTRNIPSVCIPDDHDVYQGNLWGAGGRHTEKDDKGGYMMPAEFVKMVERTQSSHLPDPYDPTPIEQGIGVYYSHLVVGGVSFAIIEDRKFKSGCNGLCPKTTSGRADHVIDPNFDPKTADVKGAILLGDRQLKFLRDWAADWQGGIEMKCSLAQSIFAGMATHHGGNLQFLVADYDCNGWPQTGRNKALHELRRGFAFMIGGDQHLATIVHHGIDDWNDAGWSFCVPSVANFYPRAWLPKEEGKNRPDGLPAFCGEHKDGLGNKVTVYAATNPGKATGHEPAALHDRMPGYGIVRFNKKDRTITMECWPRYADPADPKTGKQYEGWPKTVTQADNYARKPAGYLPTLDIKGMIDPVVQVSDAKGDVVYTLRIKGTSFRPPVFGPGPFTIKVGEPGTDKLETLKNVKPDDKGKLTVELGS